MFLCQHIIMIIFKKLLLNRNNYDSIRLEVLIMNLIGNRIKSLRKSAELTQEGLAKELRNRYNLKSDRAMVGKWEIGYQTPEMYTIKCLADFFGVSMDFLTGKEEMLPSNDESISKEVLDLAKRLQNLNPDIRATLDHLIDLYEGDQDKK